MASSDTTSSRSRTHERGLFASENRCQTSASKGQDGKTKRICKYEFAICCRCCSPGPHVGVSVVALTAWKTVSLRYAFGGIWL